MYAKPMSTNTQRNKITDRCLRWSDLQDLKKGSLIYGLIRMNKLTLENEKASADFGLIKSGSSSPDRRGNNCGIFFVKFL